MLLNTSRGGDGSSGVGPWAPPMCLFGEADNAGLRGADSPRLSRSRWAGQALHPRGGSWRQDPGTRATPLLVALCKGLPCRLAGREAGRSGPSVSALAQ